MDTQFKQNVSMKTVETRQQLQIPSEKFKHDPPKPIAGALSTLQG